MTILIDSTMKVGFTGSQQGMTFEQQNTFNRILADSNAKEFHHGDCMGADTQAHEFALHCGISIVIHPPDLPGKRSFCFGSDFSKYRPKKLYLDRNHDIVDETDILIACPKEVKETQRSGTWATVRYAEKTGKTVLLIYPSGRIFKCSPGFGRRS